MPDAPIIPADRPLLGIGLRILAATALAGMSAFLKAASLRGVAVGEMIFYRNIGALPLILLWVLSGPGVKALATRRPFAHLTRSVIGLTSMSLIFAALTMLPLGEATTISYSAPIFATILSALVLGESIGRHRWAAVAIGFAGILLVIRPGSGGDLPTLGLVTALASAVGQAAVMVTLRQIGKTETTAAIVFWFTTFCAIAASLLLPFVGRWHDPLTLTLLIVAGLFGGIAQIALTASLRLAPVATVVPFDYLQILWAALIAWVAFAQPATTTTLVGAVLISGGGIYTALRERRRGREPAQALAPNEI